MLKWYSWHNVFLSSCPLSSSQHCSTISLTLSTSPAHFPHLPLVPQYCQLILTMVQQSLQSLPLLPFLLLSFELLLVLHLLHLPILHAPALMEESSKQVLKLIFILPSLYGLLSAVRVISPVSLLNLNKSIMMMFFSSSSLTHLSQTSRSSFPGMSVQGKAVQIEPELDNPDPPVPDGAVTSGRWW